MDLQIMEDLMFFNKMMMVIKKIKKKMRKKVMEV